MTDIVSGVLKLTFGFLIQRLKDCNIADQNCRSLIATEINAIQTKLVGLARKDLLSSLCFLQEGVDGLYQSIQKSKPNKNAVPATYVRAPSKGTSGGKLSVNDAISLINAATSLKIHSEERFKSAIRSLQLSREKATVAFCDEDLSIEDRIIASQVRMVARISENLEDPDAGVSDCLQYLKQLHDIKAIREIVSVLVGGGVKSLFNQERRYSITSSVHLTNQLLFDFVRQFTNLRTGKLEWPTVLLGVKKVYLPVFGDDHLFKNLQRSGVEVVTRHFDFRFDNGSPSSVVNSRNEIVAHTFGENNAIKIFHPTRGGRPFCEVPESQGCVAVMDIDAEDNLYVVMESERFNITLFTFKLFKEKWNNKLLIFDNAGNKKREFALPFLQNDSANIYMTITERDGKIAFHDMAKNTIYVGHVCIELNSFILDKTFDFPITLELFPCFDIRFTDMSGTKIIARYLQVVCIYNTENGQLERKIKVPEKHGLIYSVAINHATKRILVQTDSSKKPGSLLSFSVETGELTDSLCLGTSKWIQKTKLVSHPSGPVALVGYREAAIIQLKKYDK